MQSERKENIHLDNSDDRTQYGVFSVYGYTNANGPGEELTTIETDVCDISTIQCSKPVKNDNTVYGIIKKSDEVYEVKVQDIPIVQEK